MFAMLINYCLLNKKKRCKWNWNRLINKIQQKTLWTQPLLYLSNTNNCKPTKYQRPLTIPGHSELHQHTCSVHHTMSSLLTVRCRIHEIPRTMNFWITNEFITLLLIVKFVGIRTQWYQQTCVQIKWIWI